MNDNKFDCLLLHGWGFNNGIMDNFAKGVTCSGKILIPCLYEITRAVNEYSFESIANKVSKEIHQDTIVIGWSIGGLIATRLALLTDKVKAIVYIASVPRFMNDDKWKNTIDRKDFDELEKTFNRDPLLALETFAGLTSIGEISVKNTKKLLCKFLTDATTNKDILIKWLIELKKTDLREEFSSLNIPVLFLLGDHDALVAPEVVRQLKKLLPEARCELIKDCGHAPFISMEYETQNLINDFINVTNN